MPLSHPKLTIPNLIKLKSAQLKHLAYLTGLNLTGTKTELATRIAASVFEPERERKDVSTKTSRKSTGSKTTVTRDTKNGTTSKGHGAASSLRNKSSSSAEEETQTILSIDMGIRNLAYCVLTVPTCRTLTSTVSTNYIPYKSSTPVPPSPLSPFATLDTWSLLSLHLNTFSNPTQTPAHFQPHSKSPAQPHLPPGTQTPDPFSLPPLSLTASRLLSSLVLSPTTHSIPNTVLIEKQRWRTLGAAAVQQWTVRVNTLEALLWGGLAVAKEHGLWGGEVMSVDPGGVARWWGVGLGERKGGKKEKVEIVRGWLRGKETVGIENEGVEGVVRGFVGEDGEGKGRRGRRKGIEREEKDRSVKKGKEKWDDLADCLLQGVAWCQWEGNRSVLREKGVEGLLDWVKE